MKNLDDIIEEAKRKIGKDSDRQLAIYIGVTASAVSQWRNKTSSPDTYALFQLQNLLGVDARELMAIIEAERAKTEEKRSYWEEIKAGFSKSGTSIAVAIALGTMMTASPRPSEAAVRNEGITDLKSVYYVK